MCHLGTDEIYLMHIQREHLLDAERERLARLARQPGRPIRGRLADWLHDLGARLEDRPSRLDPEAATS
jgi:hypothetical protein